MRLLPEALSRIEYENTHRTDRLNQPVPPSATIMDLLADRADLQWLVDHFAVAVRRILPCVPDEDATHLTVLLELAEPHAVPA